MDRRHYLALIGSSVTLSLAGCTGGDDDNGDNGGSNGGDDDNGDNGGDDSTGNGNNGGETGGDNGGENGSDDSTDNGGDGGTGDNGSDGSPPSNYEISADVPAVVEIGEEWTYTLTLENTGDGSGDGRATYGINAIGEDGTTERVAGSEIELAPGESETIESDSSVAQEARVVTLEFFIEGPDNEDRV
jgi:hypothetical protein